MYLSENSRVIVQGITGKQGQFHTRLMLEYGTNIVGGVSPKKAGQEISGVPVFASMKKAVKQTNADTSIIFVPAKYTYAAVMESLNAGITLTCVITEHVPILDTLKYVEHARRLGLKVIGPNCPGLFIPEKVKLGIMPDNLCKFGDVAVISKSGTLSYEITKAIGDAGIGLSAYIGIGGDPVRGTTMVEALEYYENDPGTKKIVLIGEIGSDEEEKAAAFIKEHASKPVVAYVAGKSAPEGKRMGHAGAIISGNVGTAKGKIDAFRNAGAIIADQPWDIPQFLKQLDKKQLDKKQLDKKQLDKKQLDKKQFL